ncbi:MAG: class I SAM-dependent methyltransferase [Candidatus Acidiferrales bacterium]
MRSPFYGPELAAIHQKKYEQISTRRAAALLALLRRNGLPRGAVVDLACGPGGWARELTLHGYDVLGVDISRAMIALARQRAPRARFICGSMATTRLSSCDAVTVLGEGFNYLMRPRDVRRMFRRVHRALRDGGLLLFDTAEPLGKRKVSREIVLRTKKVRVNVTVREDSLRRLMVRRMVILSQTRQRARRSIEVHRQRTYRGAELAGWLRRAGFRARMLRGPRFVLSERHALLLARKR